MKSFRINFELCSFLFRYMKWNHRYRWWSNEILWNVLNAECFFSRIGFWLPQKVRWYRKNLRVFFCCKNYKVIVNSLFLSVFWTFFIRIRIRNSSKKNPSTFKKKKTRFFLVLRIQIPFKIMNKKQNNIFIQTRFFIKKHYLFC